MTAAIPGLERSSSGEHLRFSNLEMPRAGVLACYDLGKSEKNMAEDISVVALTTSIVAAYVEKNHLPADQLPALIQTVHGALGSVRDPAEAAPAATKLSPAQIRRSIRPDALISFEDGKGYKQLKRHLTTRGLTPKAYREKWGLPGDYPLVAASYSATRSALAKAAGLGRKPAANPPKPAQPEVTLAKTRIKGKLSLFGRRSDAN